MSDKEIEAAIALLRKNGYGVEAPSDERYGCHVELFAMPDGYQPDECVLDYGNPNDCVYAGHIKCREECKYWRRVTPESVREARGED